MVTRIGVNTATAIQSSRSNPGTPSGRYQIAGVTAQGPTGSRVVRSLGEFVSVYGPRTAYSTHMYDAAALFFSEGGSELVVTRVVGPAATGRWAASDGAESAESRRPSNLLRLVPAKEVETISPARRRWSPGRRPPRSAPSAPSTGNG